MMRCRSISLVLAVVSLSIACGDDPITPIAPTPPQTSTETFTGTVNKNGAVTHTFTTGSAGTVTGTLTMVSAGAELVVGFGLGTWNGTTCQVTLASDRSVQGSVVTGLVSSVGTLCARVYDVGNIVDPINYEISIVHP
jgi:hypothetical protein